MIAADSTAARQRQGRLVVLSLFVTLFLVFGSSYNTAGVFFAPLLKHFGWSRARLSSLQTVLALTAGISVPIVGWLLDRIEARLVIAIGTVLAGVGFLLASQADSFGQMFIAYAALGLGIAAATLLPCSLVVSNWFDDGRGMALALAMSGTSLGGMCMTIVADRTIRWASWRAAYITLALPMFAIALPIVLLTIRTRPKSGAAMRAAPGLAGLEVIEALRSRSFWMIGAAQFCFTFAVTGCGLHLVPYLIGIGYAPGGAALVLSLTMGLAALGKVIFGILADRIGSRQGLALCLAVTAIGQTLLLGARSLPALAGYTVVYGLSAGAPLALIPMAIAESMGLKRFGTLAGLTGVITTIGAAIGPVTAGWIFDLSSRYAGAFELFTVTLLLGALAALGCEPLRTERSVAGSRLGLPGERNLT